MKYITKIKDFFNRPSIIDALELEIDALKLEAAYLKLENNILESKNKVFINSISLMYKPEKTLIIHPKDNSTDFLKGIYKNIPNITLITEGKSKNEIKQLIEKHDRIMMMGHGSSNGLFAVGDWPDKHSYIIDESIVNILSKKDNSVFIWCNADGFVNKFKLKGFFSGMFISESNYGFVNIVSEHIYKPQDEMYNQITNKYNILAKYNKVASYNSIRLYLNK
jgi:hypothetical protein